jgi:DNA-directed RNA polymerase specialized sigma24 family protein
VFTIARHEVLDWRRQGARKPTEQLLVTDTVKLAASDDPAVEALDGIATRARGVPEVGVSCCAVGLVDQPTKDVAAT